MKKSKGLLALTALLFLMSSCVYSLFPIYTEDTLVFLPELIGKWQTNSTGDYIEFAATTSEDTKRIKVNKSEIKFTMNDDSDGNPETYNYEIKGKGWVARSDDPIKVEVNGELIDDPKAVKAYYDSLFGSVKSDAESSLGIMANKLDSAVNSKGNELGNVMNNLSEGLGKLGDALKDVEAKVKGSSMISKKESYKMTVVEDGVPRAYLVHVVEIGEDYFLDIYPMAEFTNETISENLFPVHTFMKMNLKD